MQVAIKHHVDVWAEVDLKSKEVVKVTVDDTHVSRPIEYRVVLEGGLYDTTRYPGRKMAKAARAVLDHASVGWPAWDVGF